MSPRVAHSSSGLWRFFRQPALAAFRMVSRINLYRDYRYVFILGHMRSGSTLLSHILASHPDFVGAGEMHVTYRTPQDLPTLVLKTCEFLHRPLLHQNYVVDQINHDFVSDEVLRSGRVSKSIILLRAPEPTLQSMMNLAIWHEKGALAAYVNRLQELAHYGSVLGPHALLVEYEDLVDRTGETLAALTRYFDIAPPFTADYKVQRTSGRIGDPSGNIASGRIVRTPRHDTSIGADTLAEAKEHYLKRRAQLLSCGLQLLPQPAADAADKTPKASAPDSAA